VCLPFIFPRVAPVGEQSRTNVRDKCSATFRLINVNANRQTHCMKTELYVGLDVDKEWMVSAVAEWGRNGAVQDQGAISNDLHALEKFLARLRKRYGRDVIIRAVLRSWSVRVWDCPAFEAAGSGMRGGGAFTHADAGR
jgi:hypothetical protein